MDEEKKIFESLLEIEKLYSTADQLINITYPVVKDTKLLLRGLENLYKGIILNISTILKVEYIFRRVSMGEDKKENLRIFFEKCALSYGLNQVEVRTIKELLFFGKKHSESGFEFSRKGKLIIMDDELGTYELTHEKSKSFWSTSRKLLENTNNKFKQIFRKV